MVPFIDHCLFLRNNREMVGLESSIFLSFLMKKLEQRKHMAATFFLCSAEIKKLKKI